MCIYIYIYIYMYVCISLYILLFSCPVMSDSLRPHGLQHTRHPCPSPSTISLSLPKFMYIEAPMQGCISRRRGHQGWDGRVASLMQWRYIYIYIYMHICIFKFFCKHQFCPLIKKMFWTKMFILKIFFLLKFGYIQITEAKRFISSLLVVTN